MPPREALGQRDRASKAGLGQHVLQGGAHRGRGQRVGRECAADPTGIGRFKARVRADALRDPFAQAVDRARDPAGHRLAEREEVGLEPVRARIPTRTRADGVRLVDDEQCAGPAGEFPERRVEARLGMHDPDVGERRLGQHARHIAMAQRGFQRRQIVELDDACRERRVHGRPDVPLARHHAAVPKRRERLVDRAVIAPVEHQNLGAAGNFARQADGEAVGVGGGDGELPVRKAEAAGQLLAYPNRIFGREHEREAEPSLRAYGFDGGGRGMSGHRPGVAEAEVQIAVPVDVGEVPAVAGRGEQRKPAGPPLHPLHGHAAEQGAAGPGGSSASERGCASRKRRSSSASRTPRRPRSRIMPAPAPVPPRLRARLPSRRDLRRSPHPRR